MRKITKSAVKCKSCGHTIKYEEVEEFCDECGKQMKWDKERGYNHSFTFIMHPIGCNRLDDPNFCSIECAFKWLLKHGKKRLKNPEDFMTLGYFHKKDLTKLFKILKIK